MIEVLLVIGIFFYLFVQLFVWLFNAIIGILPYKVANAICRIARFLVAVFIILLIIDMF